MRPKTRPRRPLRRDRGRGALPGPRGAELGILLLLLVALVPSAAGAEQRLSILSRSVRATGVTPGGCTVFMGTARSPEAWLARAQGWLEPFVDTARRGRAILDLGSEVPGKSIWAAVDVSTGQLSVAAPPGYAAQPETADPSQLFAAADVFEIRRGRIELLVVRPGTGAYAASFSDGAGRDSVADGTIRVPVAALGKVWPEVGGLSSLSSIEVGDVVVGFDPVAMSYFAFELPAP